ncbi:MAG: hypothetical protein Q7S57_05205 [bacterium]|nr:hypothetical protein [bacterium]
MKEYIRIIIYIVYEKMLSYILNKPEVFSAIIQVVGALMVSLIGVGVAFRQIQSQFKQKVVYDGWMSLQEKLFDFSHKLVDYNASIQFLPWYLEQRHNRLVNGGNEQEYERKRRDELDEKYIAMHGSFNDFIQSYEDHEVIFLSLRKMKKEFYERFDDRIGVYIFWEIERNIFPQYFGQNSEKNVDEIKQMIKKHTQDTMDLIVWLGDFRIQLQNLTIGKILGQSVPERVPEEEHEVLRKDGFVKIKGK